jgi:putative intracellular protease/amidase
MEIAILLFDRMTALDAVGPYEVLRRLPGAEVRFYAKSAGPQRADSGTLALVADHTLEEATAPEILVVPGGIGTRELMHDEEILDWVRRLDRSTRWTTSVCTGSLILGAAGILRGLKATSHWLTLDMLESLGAVPSSERVVVEGKVMTAAGVSAGIDMALLLAKEEAGDDIAQAIQLGIEYDPQPPFDSGSPLRAPAHVVEMVRGVASGST